MKKRDCLKADRRLASSYSKPRSYRKCTHSPRTSQPELSRSISWQIGRCSRLGKSQAWLLKPRLRLWSVLDLDRLRAYTLHCERNIPQQPCIRCELPFGLRRGESSMAYATINCSFSSVLRYYTRLEKLEYRIASFKSPSGWSKLSKT